MSDLQDRLAAASTFLLQSPPGEVNDVFSDIRLLVSSDAAFESAILPALKQYNKEQFTVVDHPTERGKKVLVTPVSVLDAEGEEGDGAEERHVDWRGGEAKSFAFDHMKATASDLATLPSHQTYDSETLSLLSSLDKLLVGYTENHYSDGVCAVYPLRDENYPDPDPEAAAEDKTEEVKEAGQAEAGELAHDLPAEETEGAETAAETAEAASSVLHEGVEEGEPIKVGTPAAAEAALEGEPAQEEEVQGPEEKKERPPRASRVFGLYLVGNKYNPSNYWTGRWRSTYVLDYAKGTLEGTAKINIHYYEQGNVQLSTTLHSSSPLPPSPTAEQIIFALKSSESTFSTSLSTTYSQLSDESFRGLRRALPKTRSKIDWSKAGGYRLGLELGGGGAGAV
ncbi:hypothetical protein JCM21900_002834 [Sporobolomyces salmonicolor]